jgi:hypothetical protein
VCPTGWSGDAVSRVLGPSSPDEYNHGTKQGPLTRRQSCRRTNNSPIMVNDNNHSIVRVFGLTINCRHISRIRDPLGLGQDLEPQRFVRRPVIGEFKSRAWGYPAWPRLSISPQNRSFLGRTGACDWGQINFEARRVRSTRLETPRIELTHSGWATDMQVHSRNPLATLEGFCIDLAFRKQL